MTTDEAFDMTLAVARALNKGGITVRIKPKTKPNPETVARHAGRPERVVVGRWVGVHFRCRTTDHAKLIVQRQQELSAQGISFDTGGGGCGRDWELDWSFAYVPLDGPNLPPLETAMEGYNLGDET